MVTSFLICLVTYGFNTPEKYDYIRISLLPLRIAVGIGIGLQTDQPNQYISVIAVSSAPFQWPCHGPCHGPCLEVFAILSILVLVIDFIFGDLFLSLGPKVSTGSQG